MNVGQYGGGYGSAPRMRFGPGRVPPVVKYLLIANVTGSVGGRKQAETHASDFPELVKRLAEL